MRNHARIEHVFKKGYVNTHAYEHYIIFSLNEIMLFDVIHIKYYNEIELISFTICMYIYISVYIA